MTSRRAQSACGQLAIETKGEANLIVACHCEPCQRRTGTPRQVSAWFPDGQVVAISGDATSYRRTGDLGSETEFRFCPQCGTTLYWTSTSTPDTHAVAAGCFVDRDFPQPVLEIYTCRRPDWLPAIEGAAAFDTVPSAPEA